MAGRIIPQGPGEEALPPPGDARRESLKQRIDELQQKAEALQVETGAHVGRKIEIDNEIASNVDHLNPPNADPAFKYCWVFNDPRKTLGNRQMMHKKAEGWAPCKWDDWDMVGMEEHRHVDGHVVIGDTTLMRLPLDRYLALDKRRKARQRLIEDGLHSELEEMGAKYAAQGIKVHTPNNMSPELQKRIYGRAQAQQIAGKQFDDMVRTGTVPGHPAPGVR